MAFKNCVPEINQVACKSIVFVDFCNNNDNNKSIMIMLIIMIITIMIMMMMMITYRTYPENFIKIRSLVFL